MTTDRYSDDQGPLSVYRAIVKFKLSSGGISPSIQELVDRTGYSSTKPVSHRLEELEDMGLIRRSTHTPRTIRVLGETWRPPADTPEIHYTQARVYKFIIAYCKRTKGIPPTMGEISDRMGYRSGSTAWHHIVKLEELGVIKNSGGHRGIKVTGSEYGFNVEKVPEIGRGIVSQELAEILVINQA